MGDMGPGEYFICGGFGGICTVVVGHPLDTIKRSKQKGENKVFAANSTGANAPKVYNGPVDVVKKLYKQGGISSIYRGAGATLLRDVPASGMYFLTYEAIKDYVTEYGTKDITILGTILAGGSAGISNWLIGMPADVLKSRLQTAPEGTYKNGIRDVFKQLMKTEGPLALYKGITPVLLRAFPANAACFVGFELCKKFIDFLFPKKKPTTEQIA
ncbi:unnamed protein product [Diabrotica balteata]|uniref:Congested-like trachea protein n=1 Tax=Diabrotica balteata TaxID=107213 RepID=A0A9N9XAX3_DIABA|nr:unnamed protein product [Diabrotica balteata]